MARKRDPKRDQAFEIWKASDGQKDLIEIAAELGVPDGTVRGWKNKDKWEQKLNGTFQKNEEKQTERSLKNTERSKRRKEPPAKVSPIKEDDLTPQQQRFVEEFLIDFNQTQAAIRAGYSENTAKKQAFRLLANVGVRKRIAEGIQDLRERFKQDSMAAYFALWKQIHEIDRQLADHEEAQEKLREIKEEYVQAMIHGPEEKVVRLRLEMDLYSERVMRHGNWVKAQELRTSILQDILDRGGFKPLELLSDDPIKMELALNKDRREEERLAIEKEKLALLKQSEQDEQPTQIVVRRWTDDCSGS
jgi:phage terminase small subunit